MVKNLHSKLTLALAAVAVCGVASVRTGQTAPVSAPVSAPVASAPDAGEYEVQTTPKQGTEAWRPGEVIVKFRTSGIPAPVSLSAKSGKVRASGSATGLNEILTRYGASESEQLMPLTGAQVAPAITRSYSGEPVADSNLSGLYLLSLDASKISDLEAVAAEFSSLPEVEYAEPNYIVHTCSTDYTGDPMYSQQWGIPAIGLDKLWEVPVKSDKRPVIAILDTGVEIEHPDLAANIWTNEAESTGAEGTDDDRNGFADDVHGWDFVNNSGRMRDNNGHGTHCAGIAAAVGGNGIGITGANPDALIMPVAVMQSNGTGDVGTIVRGIDYAVANGADVISMSFGGYYESMAEREALAKAYQKAVLVAAAGNEEGCINFGMLYCKHDEPGRLFPASYSFVLGVEASSDTSGELAPFSNFDCDGPITSPFFELYNFELRAPGVGIISTFPGGQYKSLSGTSMACPLAAGAVSRLIMAREVRNKEELFGDLIATTKGNMDIFSAYSLTDADRKPTLSLVSYKIDDTEEGDGDERADAGETLLIYPTLKNAWGTAENVSYKIRLADLEDPEIASFPNDDESIAFPVMSSYATATADTPAVIKINPSCNDGRIIQFVIEATCDNISEPMSTIINVKVENGVQLQGVLKEDMTLTPDKHYIVTGNLAVPEGITLTILPGTTINFTRNFGISVSGILKADGEPGKMITFNGSGANVNQAILTYGNTLSYCVFQNFKVSQRALNVPLSHCILRYIDAPNTYLKGPNMEEVWDHCIISECKSAINGFHQSNVKNCVIANNEKGSINSDWFVQATVIDSNLLPSRLDNGEYRSVGFYSDKPAIYSSTSYLGASNKNVLRKLVMDINDPICTSMGELDLSNIRTRPFAECHATVWKVVVDGFDAQDEYDMLPPLGVGKHKFEVYFNRKMNHEATPQIAMGVREPYTQTVIAEEGSWRTETFDGDDVDIYTAYLTIKGRDSYDGINTIRVWDAEDDEFFPIPIEDVRFHVNVQSAGSMSTGFYAEAAVGRVELKWENPEENFDDMLGYNMYRYELDENNNPGDTTCINSQLLTKEEFTDYDIEPGRTYNYYYKVLRTSMDENSPSKVVSATPRAAGKGDADASGAVDVADVVTIVNYMVGHDPKPFMLEAADVNSDSEVDILDVVGTVNIILQPTAAAAGIQSTATYRIQDGMLYVDSPVELAGIQAELTGKEGATEIRALEALTGMEKTGEWIAEDAYRFLSFSLSGRTIAVGEHAVLEIGDAQLENLILVAPDGRNVEVGEAATGIIGIAAESEMKNPTPNPFVDELSVTLAIEGEGIHSVELAFYSLTGGKMLGRKMMLTSGQHTVTLSGASLPKGMYILGMSVDGKNAGSHKVIKK